jgi:uncharacterized membrane protein
MKIKTFLICWIATFVVVFGLNGVFHTVLAAGFFDAHLSQLKPAIHNMSDSNPAWVALLDAVLTFGMVYFITIRQTDRISFAKAAIAGGLLNLISSGAWNFANAATFAWSLSVTVADIAWHVSLGALGGLIVSAIYNRLERRATVGAVA